MDQTKEAKEAYKMLSDQIINKYGVVDKYLKILKMMQRYLVMINDALWRNNKFDKWKAEKLKVQIDKLIDENSGGTKEGTLVIIGTMIYGHPVKSSDFTVDTYYTNYRAAEKIIAQQKKNLKDG